jgi:hypothetical protein
VYLIKLWFSWEFGMDRHFAQTQDCVCRKFALTEHTTGIGRDHPERHSDAPPRFGRTPYRTQAPTTAEKHTVTYTRRPIIRYTLFIFRNIMTELGGRKGYVSIEYAPLWSEFASCFWVLMSWEEQNCGLFPTSARRDHRKSNGFKL